MKPSALALCAIFAMVLTVSGAQGEKSDSIHSALTHVIERLVNSSARVAKHGGDDEDFKLFGADDSSTEAQEDPMNVDKKYARLSYFRAPTRPRYGWSNRGRYSSSRKPKMPWEYLPNNYCFRNRCRSNFDCCRKYNLCNPAAKLCYDCWYGHPCRRNEDCCEKYPTCNRARGMCVD